MSDTRQTDLLDKGCRDPRMGVSDQEFGQLFCVRCRNNTCTRAKWATDEFTARVLTQEERFFNPVIGDPSEYGHILDFASLFQEAMRLETADRRGDWEIPEIPVRDGGTTKADSSISEAVDRAVAALSGRSESLSEKPQESQNVAVLDTYRATGQEVLEQENFQEIEHFFPESPAPDAVRISDSIPSSGNIPMPQGGLMVGGAFHKTPIEEPDPWIPKKKTKMVDPGAVIRMGSFDD